MATQQILFAETIAGMKKAFKRKSYESDSDSDVESYGNRGQKLKKRARFARKGQLVPTDGPGAYKETVDYAGVRRSIIHRNSPLVDEDGYEVYSEDDEQRIEDALAAAAELNPYANIRLEHVLAPLTASTDLPSHPTLSKPFTSKTLTDLVAQSCDLMHKENNSLWQVRHLWTALCGDWTWAPCETMLGPNDIELYSGDHTARQLLSLAKGSSESNGGSAPLAITNGDAASETVEAGTTGAASATEVQANRDGAREHGDATTAGTDSGHKNDESKLDGLGSIEEGDGSKTGDGVPNNSENAGPTDERLPPDGGVLTRQRRGTEAATESAEVEMQLEEESALDARRALDKTGDHAASNKSEGSDEPFVHPMFLIPAGAKPDRDVGLPEAEAEDVRRLLALYIQKQEEVCRGTKRLHQGLLKAEKLRKDVLHWSKAEAHSGLNRDMSDGEDWYDKEEWGLTEDLKKGQDEEEEDAATTGKKTRARR